MEGPPPDWKKGGDCHQTADFCSLSLSYTHTWKEGGHWPALCRCSSLSAPHATIQPEQQLDLHTHGAVGDFLAEVVVAAAAAAVVSSHLRQAHHSLSLLFSLSPPPLC